MNRDRVKVLGVAVALALPAWSVAAPADHNAYTSPPSYGTAAGDAEEEKKEKKEAPKLTEQTPEPLAQTAPSTQNQ